MPVAHTSTCKLVEQAHFRGAGGG
ncbi:uncharacterized protein METZ01_LOCUS24081 [marine metagenome]|uniref:Uncharacterized protein n=1 Tax=marine metagenome TaxID=408172 RepID=A0A381PZ51_9ZZZZ